MNIVNQVRWFVERHALASLLTFVLGTVVGLSLLKLFGFDISNRGMLVVVLCSVPTAMVFIAYEWYAMGACFYHQRSEFFVLEKLEYWLLSMLGFLAMSVMVGVVFTSQPDYPGYSMVSTEQQFMGVTLCVHIAVFGVYFQKLLEITFFKTDALK